MALHLVGTQQSLVVRGLQWFHTLVASQSDLCAGSKKHMARSTCLLPLPPSDQRRNNKTTLSQSMVQIRTRTDSGYLSQPPSCSCRLCCQMPLRPPPASGHNPSGSMHQQAVDPSLTVQLVLERKDTTFVTIQRRSPFSARLMLYCRQT